jgi:hypothetical protein
MLLQRKKLNASFATFVLLAVFGLAAPTPGQAALIFGEPVLLSTLVDNPQDSITVGDKRFSNFEYSAVGDMPDADRINVTRIQDDLGNLGIRFTGPFIDLVGNGGSDATILYRVEALNQGQLITDVHLEGNPNVLGDGGSASVTEKFGSQQIDIYEDFGNLKLVDWADLPAPVRFLDVEKDILLFGQTGSATISIIDQTFSQVPEPTAIFLALVGMTIIGCARRRGGGLR